MALKPMDKHPGLDSWQVVWEAIRRLKTFTVRQLREETLMDIKSVRDYVVGLEASGYLFGLMTVPKKWELVKDIGVEAPRVRKDGTPVTQGGGRKNMWEGYAHPPCFHGPRTGGCREHARLSGTGVDRRRLRQTPVPRRVFEENRKPLSIPAFGLHWTDGASGPAEQAGTRSSWTAPSLPPAPRRLEATISIRWLKSSG